MQKKLIALAVAGLISAPAFAQSKVEIYGIVDMGFSWRGDNVAKGISSRHGFDSGQSMGSRLGFRGTEDLGNGLKASFVLEEGINVDRGTSAQGGKTFGRQAYLALSGKFGTVAMGRQYTPQYVLLANHIDPFGKGTVGRIANVYAGDDRLDNLLAYVSPSWGGFSFIAGYTAQGIGDESPGNKSADARVYAFTPMYANGPLLVALNYHQSNLKNKGDKDNKIKVYDLMGAYDFGFAKISGTYGKRKVDTVDYLAFLGGSFAENNGQDSSQWMLGATVPLGPNNIHKIMASYTHRKTELGKGISDAKASQWAVGYEYAMSKRTALYAAYSDQSNSRNAKNFGVMGTAGDASNAGQGYQRGVNLGIRHTF